MKQEAGSKGEAYQKERAVIRIEDDVGGRARVRPTCDEKQVLWGG